jgi:hypothetical protein
MGQGRLIVTIAAGIVLGGVALALLPFALLGSLAVLGVLLHVVVILLPLLMVGGGIYGAVRLWRALARARA